MLLGGAGNDVFYGQDGDDRIDGGSCSESHYGGAGMDKDGYG